MKALYKVVFRNSIGKTLYLADISKRHSKVRRVPEKVNKNQLKIRVLKWNDERKRHEAQCCLVNFQRLEDLKAFEEEFGRLMKELEQQT